MRANRNLSEKGFTLVEVFLAIIIISVLAVLIVPKVVGQVKKAQKAEAIHNLGAIRSAELLLQNLSGKFVAAADALSIQSVLGLSVTGNFYDYKIIEASEENFLGIATPVGPLANWLDEIKIDKDGLIDFVASSSGSGNRSGDGSNSSDGSSGGSGGTLGGSSGGGSNGSGGGSSQVVGYGTTHGSVGGTSIPIVTLPATNLLMPFPTNVTVTANDGWLHIGWDPGTTGSSAVVYRASRINGVIGDFAVLTGTPNEGWSDETVNGMDYCYQVASYNQTTNEQSELSAPPVCGAASATSAAALAIGGAKSGLAASETAIIGVNGITSGKQIADWIDATDYPILYGRTSCSTVSGRTLCTEAYFDPNTDTLVLGLDLLNNAQQSAVVLAHEEMHAIWRDDYNKYLNGIPGFPQYGIPPDPPGGVRSDNSIDQEYAAFSTDLQVYYHLKNQHSMPSVSRWDSIMPKFLDITTGKPLDSEAEGKIYLRGMYTDLPEY